MDLNDLRTLVRSEVDRVLHSARLTGAVSVTMRDRADAITHALVTDAVAYAQRDPAQARDPRRALQTDGFRALLPYRVAHALWTVAQAEPRVVRRDLERRAVALSAAGRRPAGIELPPGATLEPPTVIDHGGGNVFGWAASAGRGLVVLQNTHVGSRPPESPVRRRVGVVGETAIVGAGTAMSPSCVLGARAAADGPSGRRHPVLGTGNTLASLATVIGLVTTGDGVTVGANAWVWADLEEKVTIEHDAEVRARIGAHAHVGARSIIHAPIGAHTHVGDAVLVLRPVGQRCRIGAGCVVLSPVPDGTELAPGTRFDDEGTEPPGGAR
jgi:serine O-acetyltransferase